MYENPSNANNVWASLRTFDAYGIQYIDIIMQVSYHDVQFTVVVLCDIMILNTKYMIQDVLIHPDFQACHNQTSGAFDKHYKLHIWI